MSRIIPQGATSVSRSTPRISLDDFEWQDDSEHGDKSRLLGSLQIGAHFRMHVQAYEVTEDQDHVQQYRGSYGEDADQVNAILGECAWDTIDIEGRAYVLIATPYCL